LLINIFKNLQQVFPDGSVLENEQASLSYQSLRLPEKSFYLGKGISIITTELAALLMAMASIKLIH